MKDTTTDAVGNETERLLTYGRDPEFHKVAEYGRDELTKYVLQTLAGRRQELGDPHSSDEPVGAPEYHPPLVVPATSGADRVVVIDTAGSGPGWAQPGSGVGVLQAAAAAASSPVSMSPRYAPEVAAMSSVPDSFRNRNGRPPPDGLMVPPLRYGWRDRWSDWHTAGLDGREGLPNLAAGQTTTRRITRLVSQFSEAANLELARCYQDCADWLVELAGLGKAAAGASMSAGAGSGDFTEDWRSNQRDKRGREREARRRVLLRQIENREKQWIIQRNRLSDHFVMRMNAYLARLIRVHPDGDTVQEVLPNLGLSEIRAALRRLDGLGNHQPSKDHDGDDETSE